MKVKARRSFVIIRGLPLNQTAKYPMPLHCWPDLPFMAKLIHSGGVCFDPQIPFAKATGMNRYRLADAQGEILMSLPVCGGRSHHQLLGEVHLALEKHPKGTKWTVTHWRRIQNGYRRAPYFEYFENDLRSLILEPDEPLMQYNLRVLEWLLNRLQIGTPISISEANCPLDVPWSEFIARKTWITPPYYQQFEDRTGFIPHLSVLDLLLQCGPQQSRNYLDRYLELNASNFASFL